MQMAGGTWLVSTLLKDSILQLIGLFQNEMELVCSARKGIAGSQ
jgi:hypothetical protein